MAEGKTVPELTALSLPIVGTDKLVLYRAPGPLASAPASAVETYIETALGLGTMSTQDAADVAITGGSVLGLSELTVVTNSTVGLAPIRVGTYGATATDTGIAVSRNMNDASTESGHGFGEFSLFRRTGTPAFAAFDAGTIMQGNNYDHWAAFQDRGAYQPSSALQVMNDAYGLFSKPSVDAGTVTRRYGVYVAAPTLTSGGAITTQYGVYTESLTTGGTNWAFYAAGTTPSYFGGAITLNAGVAGPLAVALAANTAGISVTGYSLTGTNAQSGISLTGTWNTSGNPSALNIAMTNTASGATSRLIKASVGGSDKFTVDVLGVPRIGSYGATSTDPGCVISRDMFDASTTSGHGFVEASYFRRGGTSAFAAFDALTTMAGNSYDHWAAFQDRGAWQPASGAQVMNDMFGLFSKPSLDAGTVTRRYGGYVAAPTITGGGVITTQYGYYTESLTAGATNWAFYADGATPSYFGGAVTLNGGVTGRITQTVPANTAAYQSTGYSLTGANAQTLMDLAGTWNTSGAPRALNISITNTASAATSTLLRAAVNTVAQFSVDVTGNLYAFGKGSIGTTSTTTALNIAGAPNDNAGMVKIISTSTADNAGITLFGRASGGNANARNWQLANNYSGTGSLDILRSTTNTGNPTTHTASFDTNGNFGVGINLPTQKLDVDGVIKKKVYTVATLPAATAGCEAWVSDASLTWTLGIGTVVAAGGANVVPVGYDGTNWRIG